jgi:ATP-dependent Clp protease adaptor protein ClpS
MDKVNSSSKSINEKLNELISRSKKEISSSPKNKLEKPPQYFISLLNDDFTHVDFVANLLMTEFNKDEFMANFLTWRIHNSGSAIVGQYTKDIALTKLNKVRSLAESEGFPFRGEIKLANI